ncbi:MAG: hypothetical protein SPL08_00400, partial [Pseudomonadota bacterium]|nr:hypothetical protein [Pseudomonadota bacterium]
MKKKKRYTFLWFVLNCACWGIAGVLGYDLIYRMQQEPHITYIAPEIPLEHTKYGDYLVGLMAKENHDYAKMTLAFESALSNDPDNIKLKKNVYLLKAIRGDIDAVLPLAKDLNTLRQAELLTDYVLIAEAFHNKSYDTATHLLSDKPAYGADRILKPALNAWIAVGQNDRVKAEKFLAEL